MKHKTKKYPNSERAAEFDRLWKSIVQPEYFKLLEMNKGAEMDQFKMLMLVEHVCWKLFLAMRNQNN